MQQQRHSIVAITAAVPQLRMTAARWFKSDGERRRRWDKPSSFRGRLGPSLSDSCRRRSSTIVTGAVVAAIVVDLMGSEILSKALN